ncbi:SIS domain-containing protein, partial [archaeon]|nr:SIS domain-containing protein [archaeon]
RLRGSYAVLAICEGDQKIVASRKDSPLVLGLTDDGLIFASDVSALLEWTKRVVYLQNHDLAIATNLGVFFQNLMLDKEVSREVSNIQWDMEQAKKGEFEHFMLKEIAEQAQTISRAIQQDEAVIKNIMELVNKTNAVFLVGCGSSYHACLVGSYLFSKVAKLNANLVVASEFERYEHFLNEESLVIAVSQSGETADVLEVVRAARERNSKIIAITNVIGSSLAREAEELLLMNSGPEICVLSTKTYTSQVVLMFLLAYSLDGQKDKCSRRIKGLYMDVYNLTSKSMREELKALAGVLADREHIYMIGLGLQFATAKEAALKVKEVSYIHTEAF